MWIEVDFVGQPVNQGRIDEITLTIDQIILKMDYPNSKQREASTTYRN
jgi:hypothetical protein